MQPIKITYSLYYGCTFHVYHHLYALFTSRCSLSNCAAHRKESFYQLFFTLLNAFKRPDAGAVGLFTSFDKQMDAIEFFMRDLPGISRCCSSPRPKWPLTHGIPAWTDKCCSRFMWNVILKGRRQCGQHRLLLALAKSTVYGSWSFIPPKRNSRDRRCGRSGSNVYGRFHLRSRSDTFSCDMKVTAVMIRLIKPYRPF